MNVGGFSTHRFEQSTLVVTFRQHREPNPATIGTESTNNPTFPQLEKRIRTPDSLLNNSSVLSAILFLAANPHARRRHRSLRFPRDPTTIPFRQSDIALAAQTSQTGHPMDHAVSLLNRRQSRGEGLHCFAGNAALECGKSI